MKKCSILGVGVNVTNMEKTISYIEKNLNNIRGEYICISNVHTTIMSYENEVYKKIQNDGLMVLPDGAPLSIISKKKGFKSASRVTGPDLMKEIFKLSEKKGYKHYFYGSTCEVLAKLEENLKIEYPKIEIVGLYSPPFRPLTADEDEKVINKINELNPDFIWIGLGAPKQEIWMNEHQNRVNGLMLGVGAGFDYHSGGLKRAPKWMQNCSLEWLYRLYQDPKRLFKRYLMTNTKFIVLILKKEFFCKVRSTEIKN